MAELKPTEEQQAVIDAARAGGKSLMVEADAGCAKTTTLKMLGKVLRGGVLGIAFNKSTAKELSGVMPGNFVIKTANGLGHGAWIRANPGVSHWELDEKKLGKLVSEVSKESGLKLSSEQWDNVRQLTTRAMQEGLVPGGEGRPLMPDTPETWMDLADDLWVPDNEQENTANLARAALIKSIALARQGVISFDDQIYCSVCLGGKFTQFEDVIVDEAQDLNKLNHEMIRMSSRVAGRIIAVGDPKQSIYAFRGAVTGSMGKLRALKAPDTWIDLPLHLTFRCPKVIVKKQQHHAPGFKAWHLNPEGAIELLPRTAPRREFDSEGMFKSTWSWKELESLLPTEQASIAILCRNNAPLMKMAFKLLRRRIGVNMLGRALGKNLVALSRKIVKDDKSGKDVCAGAIAEWRERELAAARAAGKDHKLDEIYDRAACLEAVLDDAEIRDAGEMRAMLSQLFEREAGRVTLGTGHKAKGLEWDCVVHLDPWRIGGKAARTALAEGDPVPMQQERNLHYVVDTRTRHTLVEVSLDQFQGGGA